jgi:hypothetical protein
MVEKNQAAVELGRLGGRARAERLTRDELSEIAKKGVKARMKKLTPEQRREVAQKAAAARWGKNKLSKNADNNGTIKSPPAGGKP